VGKLTREASASPRLIREFGPPPVLDTAGRCSRTAAFLLLLSLLTASPLQGRECPEGEISHVFVDNHSIFDAETLPDDGRVRWAYELANRAHVRTREDFIRGEILLSEGDCYEPELGRESARILREFRFIANADVFSVPQPDGSLHLIVDTRDEWTTKPTVAPAYDEGLRLEGASITEENFLGRGVLVSLFYRERQAIRDIGGLVEAPRLWARPVDARFEVVRTRVGMSVDQLLIQPFVAEEADVAFRQHIRRNNDFFRYQTGEAGNRAQVIVPVMEDLVDLSAAARIGRPGDLFLFGGGISWEALRLNRGAWEPQLVPEGQFEAREPASPEVREELSSQLNERQAGRLNLFLGIRRLQFQEWSGLDAIRGVQDVPFGLEATLTGGYPLGFLSGSAIPTDRDLFLRGEVFWGGTRGTMLIHGLFSGEGRHARAEPSQPGGWRDVLMEGVGLAYWRPQPGGRHLLVGKVEASGGWNAMGPFQVTLGGEDGVRGFRDHHFPGARSVVVSLEDRIRVNSPFPDFADLGLTLLADGGFIRGQNVPFGGDSGLQAAVGVGLRLGFPSGTSSVIRFDLVAPVTGDQRFGSPTFRISSREILGLLAPFGSRQLDRSRRAGVGTDFRGVATEPYRW